MLEFITSQPALLFFSQRIARIPGRGSAFNWRQMALVTGTLYHSAPPDTQIPSALAAHTFPSGNINPKKRLRSTSQLPPFDQPEYGTMQSPQSNNVGSRESLERKRALCIGIDYRHQKDELEGCIKDAKSISDFLKERGYQTQDITTLTDETNDKPTKDNILKALSSLVKDAQTGDLLFLHYSGHGGQVPDKNGDEEDKEDEVHILEDIECLDSSVITDDVRKYMKYSSPCLPGAVLRLCSIAATLGQFWYNCRGKRYESKSKLCISADVVCWSGAKDNQLGADTPRGGVMTCAFIDSLKLKPMQSYKELLHSIRTIVNRKGNQTPQLCSSNPIDANEPFTF
ncbi:caspase domain-containing protein [Armillaria mellea]|nr:caspase domain-containing protein [Armillaria mellea]